jgi:hypothetical protein
VNDESLQKAKLNEGKISIEGNEYQTLILANLPYINLATAKQINMLSKKGLNLWTIGELPQKQPSFLHYEANDKITRLLVDEAGKQKNTNHIQDDLPLHTIVQKIRFAKSVNFSRQITREMTDGSQIKFIWNKSDQWQTISLNLNKSFTASYWLNPENGTITKTSNPFSENISYQLPPYGSIILYAAKKVIAQNFLSAPTPTEMNAKDLLKIENWSIRVDDINLENSQLFDWRINEQLKYKSAEGIYTSSFEIKKIEAGKHYFVDLGKVFFTASVSINGREAGKRLFAPYSLDITKFIRTGENKIEAHITTTRRNGFIGEAMHGNPNYLQFKGKENSTIPSGLLGPVTVKQL